ncbi:MULTISPECIES: type I glyceraldehyde-3-phosphate dehydrogenase [unclassified Nitratiruptor]|uniref:type I glyceraldehyde-3-phosphate dehydrogenase n=1 Tax=unclassified Nitratiruptor TaxID=2624044 RepID=UPI00191560F4|nr:MULTISPECIES: type I glyceraldehyde-3-phosphate dehydrogenase [unclassified Nitratiruptor]BCD60362.1 glyceraldehyde 3-phosphate dehydrogenase [Nitratiruptor sp. YY08-10]BCD64149.1 glyceraldehyde 3-phosphate dehydrogenase [Nitratiruptor sp. YY08-14]
MKKVAINGLGRIGKMVLWHYSVNKPKNIEITVANGGSGTAEDLAYMLKYDSVHGKFPTKIEYGEDYLKVGDQKIQLVTGRDPEKLPWSELGVDIVLECTGHFTKRDDAAKHLKAGAKKVIISAPSKDAELTIVMGVNQDWYDPSKHDVISNASCTTNSLAPAIKVLHDAFGIENALVTTVHAYTSSQAVVDRKNPGKHRRGRTAAANIIPTTTGAAIATTKVIPELQGKMNALALRVPVPDVAITDISATLKKEVTAEEVNKAFEEAMNGELKGILEITYDEVVSTDIVNNPHSSIIDGLSTMVVDGNKVKVFAWYDNEYGYSGRLLELADFIAERM